jgi:uncharacterized membrane protein YdjX (TVP38/TMEM64 family)
MISPRWQRRLFILLLLFVAFLLGSTIQQQLGISFTLEGLEDFRRWVESLGWWGPAVFMLLVVCRLFIGLSSHLVLILGGLAFGVTGGILWGCLGLVASALVLFYLARLLGTDWIQRRFGDRYLSMLERVKRLGAIAIFAVTAHPAGLLTPAHLAAGLVDLSVGQFALAVVLAAPIRTAPYVFLGTAILDLTLRQSLMIAGVLLLLFVLPLFVPRVRHWLRS